MCEFSSIHFPLFFPNSGVYQATVWLLKVSSQHPSMEAGHPGDLMVRVPERVEEVFVKGKDAAIIQSNEIILVPLNTMKEFLTIIIIRPLTLSCTTYIDHVDIFTMNGSISYIVLMLTTFLYLYQTPLKGFENKL